MSKNIAKSTIKEVLIEQGFLVLKFQNNSDKTAFFKRSTQSSYIQLHYCVKGNCKFHFSENYNLSILDGHSIFLYNPTDDLPINLELLPKTSLVSVLIFIEKFHAFFSREASYIPFLGEQNKDKKYYDKTQTSPNVSMILQQILTAENQSSISDLYTKGKAYELLSLHFDSPENTQKQYCPFLIDDQEVLKIRKAKNIIISRMSEPPSLQDLANQVGLNLKKLKEGFKKIYGDTVYGFLFDYKMNHALELLKNSEFNVNEVGLQIGYSTSSHFIAAFKKKFGTTPKQYVMSLQ